MRYTITQLLRHSLLSKLNIQDESQFSNTARHWLPFLQLQFNRLTFGGLRYGRINKPYKKNFDRISCIKRRLNTYLEEGNTENLVDIANLCMLEFHEGNHPVKHFEATDDGDHTKEKER